MARKKGTPNKNRLPLIEKAWELGCDPFEILLLFAQGNWVKLGYDSEFIIQAGKKEYTIAPAVRAKCASDACRYLYPSKKAVEVTYSEDELRPHKNVSDAIIDED